MHVDWLMNVIGFCVLLTLPGLHNHNYCFDTKTL